MISIDPGGIAHPMALENCTIPTQDDMSRSLIPERVCRGTNRTFVRHLFCRDRLTMNNHGLRSRHLRSKLIGRVPKTVLTGLAAAHPPTSVEKAGASVVGCHWADLMVLLNQVMPGEALR